MWIKNLLSLLLILAVTPFKCAEGKTAKPTNATSHDSELPMIKKQYLFVNGTRASVIDGKLSSRSLGSLNLLYHGGPVISNVKVVLVLWKG